MCVFVCVSLLDVCRVIELLDRLQRRGELPPPKLQALQRVLQSKFCAAIREVGNCREATIPLERNNAHVVAKNFCHVQLLD